MIGLMVLAAAATLPQVRGDFDHDGKPDVARLIARGNAVDLVVRRGAEPNRPITLYSFARNADFYLDTAKPGRWRTACGKGMGDEHTPCPREYVTLRGDTLDFGVQESTELVALWTGRKFEIVWLSE